MASMAQNRSLSTPAKQTPPPVRESPGNWRHPRLAEITRRQSKTTFGEKNIKQIAYNAAAFVFLVLVRRTLLPFFSGLLRSTGLGQYGSFIFPVLLLIPLVNIGLALLPLVRPPDDLSDIPLTPSQRKLLGLPPSSRPATPNSAYSTPPRYSRTPSVGGSPAMSASPLSARASPATEWRASNSPSTASPLLQKAVAAGGRRSSFGTSSPLGASTATSIFGDSLGPSTPTPASAGKRSSVSLNNKWLYEKGRRASSNSFLNQTLSS
ncbi:nuclear pore complex component-domain-containing protein [Apodospora peruviana]|uniref:Nuclear pore complex component-domain-containing protein n=1 Tax=Apodospora peruviana TaxID=516989 RepID=A0AAE0IHY7_9PEZI|nr:nuclear pore complex component-domain-containing protein [Apodospora peruviana]